MMLYKIHGKGDFGDHVIAKSKLSQFERVGMEYQSASGPGVSARKRGDFREVRINEESEGGSKTWQVATTFERRKLVEGAWKNIRTATLATERMRASMEAHGWFPETYIGRGIVFTFNVKPQLRAYKHSFDIEDDNVAAGNLRPRKEHRVWLYSTKPGYVSISRIRYDRRRPASKRLMLPTLVDMQKFAGYGAAYRYSSSEFPGYPQIGDYALIETVGIQKPAAFAGFYDGLDGPIASLVTVNAKIAGEGGFGIPTSHATIDVIDFHTNLDPERATTYEVDLPPGEGGTGQNLFAAMPFAIAPGLICIITCEAFEPRQYYDGKMQGDFYISILDLRSWQWVVMAKKIHPVNSTSPNDLPYLRYPILGLDESGEHHRIVEVEPGDTTRRLLYSVAYENQDTRAYDYVSGLESGVGQPCCNSNAVLFTFVRFRGIKRTTVENGDGRVDRSTDILVMKIDYDGGAKVTRLDFPFTHYQKIGLPANSYSGMYSYASPQNLTLLCVGRGKFLLQIIRYSSAWTTTGEEYSTPPTAHFNFMKFLLTEDDGETWEIIDPAGIPISTGFGPNAADLGRICVLEPLSPPAYHDGEFARVVIPLFTSPSKGMAYYASDDGGRNWYEWRSIKSLDKPENMNGVGSDLNHAYGFSEALGLRVPPGLGRSDIYIDRDVRAQENPSPDDITSIPSPYSITERKVQRVFLGHNPSPMDLVRPWIYDSAYEKPKEP